MSKEGQRRSMVGAPPLSAAPRPAAKLTLKVGRKRSIKEELVDDSPESVPSEDEEETEEKPSVEKKAAEPEDKKDGRKNKKRKKMEKAVKAKRKSEKRAEAEKKPRVEELKPSPPKEPSPEPTPEPEEIPPTKASLNQYNPLQLFFDHLLRRFIDKDTEGVSGTSLARANQYFFYPVTADIAPDYNTVITQPMDFSTIRTKIEARAYNKIDEFLADAELIVKNAQTYNAPNTVYHIAASKLQKVIEYYTGEPYLRDCSQRLPFASLINWEEIGLPSPEAYAKILENRRKAAIGEEQTAEQIIKSVEKKVAQRLARRLPNAPQMAFISNENGVTVLNVLGERERMRERQTRLIDLVGPLEEGTPGIFAPSDTKLLGQAPITFLNYGPFCSFAPQFDSTWATMKRRESEMLLRTYGDRATATDALSLAALVKDSSAHFIKVVDDILDRLTDGEHSRTMAVLKTPEDERSRLVPDISNEDIPALLADIESLKALGYDVGFVAELRDALKMQPARDTAARLAASGRALQDLAGVQHSRLSQMPPQTLSRQPLPCRMETELAMNTSHMLQQHVTQVEPGQLVRDSSLHNAMGMQEDGIDMDILQEFFQ